MTTKLEMNRDIAKRIQQKFNERVDTVNYALSRAICVDLADYVFGCNEFRVILRTVGKNPQTCVHVIVVDILGVIISVKNPNKVYISNDFVIFDNEEGSGAVFDIANGS